MQSDLNRRGSCWERMHVRKGNPQADLLFNAQCTVCCVCHRLVEKECLSLTEQIHF